MFIINLTYQVELQKIDEYLEAHVNFLDEQYNKGYFLASGPKVPRNGGVILANVNETDLLESIIAKDPFKQNDLAVYEVTEFIPRKTSIELEFLQNS
ncbi:MAG: YciI family protein [Bacteroidota bacterium]